MTFDAKFINDHQKVILLLLYCHYVMFSKKYVLVRMGTIGAGGAASVQTKKVYLYRFFDTNSINIRDDTTESLCVLTELSNFDDTGSKIQRRISKAGGRSTASAIDPTIEPVMIFGHPVYINVPDHVGANDRINTGLKDTTSILDEDNVLYNKLDRIITAADKTKFDAVVNNSKTTIIDLTANPPDLDGDQPLSFVKIGVHLITEALIDVLRENLQLTVLVGWILYCINNNSFESLSDNIKVIGLYFVVSFINIYVKHSKLLNNIFSSSKYLTEKLESSIFTTTKLSNKTTRKLNTSTKDSLLKTILNLFTIIEDHENEILLKLIDVFKICRPSAITKVHNLTSLPSNYFQVTSLRPTSKAVYDIRKIVYRAPSTGDADGGGGSRANTFAKAFNVAKSATGTTLYTLPGGVVEFNTAGSQYFDELYTYFGYKIVTPAVWAARQDPDAVPEQTGDATGRQGDAQPWAIQGLPGGEGVAFATKAAHVGEEEEPSGGFVFNGQYVLTDNRVKFNYQAGVVGDGKAQVPFYGIIINLNTSHDVDKYARESPGSVYVECLSKIINDSKINNKSLIKYLPIAWLEITGSSWGNVVLPERGTSFTVTAGTHLQRTALNVNLQNLAYFEADGAIAGYSNVNIKDSSAAITFFTENNRAIYIERPKSLYALSQAIETVSKDATLRGRIKTGGAVFADAGARRNMVASIDASCKYIHYGVYSPNYFEQRLGLALTNALVLGGLLSEALLADSLGIDGGIKKFVPKKLTVSENKQSVELNGAEISLFSLIPRIKYGTTSNSIFKHFKHINLYASQNKLDYKLLDIEGLPKFKIINKLPLPDGVTVNASGLNIVWDDTLGKLRLKLASGDIIDFDDAIIEKCDEILLQHNSDPDCIELYELTKDENVDENTILDRIKEIQATTGSSFKSTNSSDLSKGHPLLNNILQKLNWPQKFVKKDNKYKYHLDKDEIKDICNSDDKYNALKSLYTGTTPAEISSNSDILKHLIAIAKYINETHDSLLNEADAPVVNPKSNTGTKSQTKTSNVSKSDYTLVPAFTTFGRLRLREQKGGYIDNAIEDRLLNYHYDGIRDTLDSISRFSTKAILNGNLLPVGPTENNTQTQFGGDVKFPSSYEDLSKYIDKIKVPPGFVVCDPSKYDTEINNLIDRVEATGVTIDPYTKAKIKTLQDEYKKTTQLAGLFAAILHQYKSQIATVPEKKKNIDLNHMIKVLKAYEKFSTASHKNGINLAEAAKAIDVIKKALDSSGKNIDDSYVNII